MAGPVYVDIRLWNPGRQNIYGDTENVLNYLERNFEGRNLKLFEIYWQGATQAAAEELGTAADSAKDGTTTPYQITVVSASANDNDIAGGHVRKIAIIGVTVTSIKAFVSDGEQPKLTVEVFAMNGTTDVLSSRYYLRTIHGYPCHYGSGGADAADAITIESPANTTLLTIVQAGNESNGGILYFADGDMVQIDISRPRIDDAALDAGDGIMITITESGFEDSLNVDPDVPTTIQLTAIDFPQYEQRPLWPIAKRATNKSSLKFAETLIGQTRLGSYRAIVRVHSKLYN